MTRECHVRFCERLRGQFPRPTHHFGMKAHIGADAESGLVHSVAGTPANVACADAGYKRPPPRVKGARSSGRSQPRAAATRI